MNDKPGMPFTVIALLLFVNTQAQSDFFNANRIKISEASLIESKLGSEIITPKLKTVYASDSGLAQPKEYARPSIRDYEAAFVTYYYSRKDSVVESVSYHFRLDDKKQPADAKIAAYHTAFDKLVSLLSRDFGSPESNQGKLTQNAETMIGDGKTIKNERVVKWDYKGCHITAHLLWTERNGEFLMAHFDWKK